MLILKDSNMSQFGEVFEEITLHTTEECFYFEPISSSEQPILKIDRLNHDISVSENKAQIPLGASKRTVYGVLGIIHLIGGPYLIVIKKRAKVGTLNRQPIYKLIDVDIIPYSKSTAALNAEQRNYNDKYLLMIQNVLSTPYFYFSYTYDLTHSLQRLYYTSEDFLQMSLSERADQRFVWNQSLLQDFAYIPKAGQFCLPIMHGFLCIKQCSINGEWFTWALLSRRSVYRAGTRMWTRGIEEEGSVANYVETEQLIEFREFRSSFIQTRGSIPLFWKQDPNLKYKPPPTLSQGNHEMAFLKHFESQIMHYGKQVAINLIDQKGSEGSLQEAFKQHVENSNSPIIKDNIKYEYFDFHHECRKMRWDRLSILMNRLAQDQDKLGYFLYREGVTLLDQDGVFRTNCIDCLDRTNVVQSMLARRHLQSALTKMNILQTGQKIEEQTAFEDLFKNIWADNADVVSIQYSGTGALKTDFTRTGKRSTQGALKDGYNSAVRYIKNNFMDGDRQDSIDLFLGKYRVDGSEGVVKPCPLKDNRDPKLLIRPLLLVFSLFMVFVCALLPSQYTAFSLMSLLLFASLTAAGLLLTLQVGSQLVNAPKLCASQLSSLST